MQIIQRPKSGLQEFNEALQPYLQLAMQNMLQRRMEEQKQQRQMDIANKAFTPTVQDIQNQATQQYGQPFNIQGLPPEIANQRITQKYGIAQQRQGMQPAIPEKIQRIMKFGEKYPGVEFGEEITGVPGFTYKSPTTMGMQPVIDPATGSILFTKPKGSVFQPELPEQKQQREVSTAREKKVAEVTDEMKGIDNMVNVVWKKADELIPTTEGVSKAAMSGLKKDIGTSKAGRLLGVGEENAITFNQFREGTLSMLIRSLGEKGMLTNQDIQRARDFEPSTWDTPKIRQDKRKAMNEFLKAKVNAFYQVQGQSAQQPDPLGLR